MPRTFFGIIALSMSAIAFHAFAQQADLTVQQDQSSVEAQICLDPSGLSKECDTDGSSITGFLAAELDDYDAPATITMHDFTLALNETLTYNMDWGFFIGGVDIVLSDVVVNYATPGTPTGPVAVDGTGNFEFPVILAIMSGTGSYSGYGPVMEALVGSGSFNLADFGATESAIAGNVSVAGGLVTIAGSQAFSNSDEIEGVVTTIDGTATIVAIGDVPACRVDLNGDGMVNTADFLMYLNLFGANDPLADWNFDGVVNALDFLNFLNDWVAGC